MTDETREESLTNDILREYQALHETLRALGRLAARRKSDGQVRFTTGSVDTELRRVRDHMERLFDFEERGGLYEELLSLLPAESPRIEALKDEHPALLARINALIFKLDGHEVAELEVLRSEIRSFVHALESHEHRDTALVQRPYYSEEGTGD